jgi:hypothetical protein
MGEPSHKPEGKKRPAHMGCVLAGTRVVAALVRCPRIDLRAAQRFGRVDSKDWEHGFCARVPWYALLLSPKEDSRRV